MLEGVPCAAAAAARGDALLATASRVRAWLVLEQPGAWGRHALVESDLDRRVGAAIVERCRRWQVRPLLIRRPGGHRSTGPRRCYLAHSGARRSWLEALEVDDPAEVLDLDLTALAADRAPGLGERRDAPVYLVCTNGRHDRCCADFGRPLVRALAAAGVGDVWECSHIGGDRFAANLVCLPEGTYFGRVDPSTGPVLASDYAVGLLDLDHLRGRSCHPTLVQAAELFVRRASGLRAMSALVVTAVRGVHDDVVEVSFATLSATTWRARVSRAPSAAAVPLTCRDEASSCPWEYQLLALDQFEPSGP